MSSEIPWAFWGWTLLPAAGLAIGNTLERVGLRTTGAVVPLREPWRFVKTLVANVPWWSGLLLSALATLGYYGAMGRYNISLVQPWMALNPALTVLLAWKFLHEPIDKRLLSAIALVFVGLLLAGTLADEQAGGQNEWRLGVFVAVGAALALLVWRFGKRVEVGDATLMGMGFGLSAVVYKSIAMDAIAVSQWNVQALLPWLLDVRLWLFVVCYTIGFAYSQIGLSRGRALFLVPLSAAVGTLVPIVAGGLVFAEPFPPLKWASTICVALGSLLFVGRDCPDKKGKQP